MTFSSRASLLAAILIAAPAWAQNPWGEVKAPSAGEAEAIGGYAAGCVAGAAALPLSGEGFQVMRSSRNRYYGHPVLVAFVERLAERAERQRLGGLLVGDLSQPRGGPAAFGHASHQSGLDVDIWFRLLPKDAQPLSRQQTEQLAMESVIRASEGVLDKKRWDRRYGDLLRLAARRPIPRPRSPTPATASSRPRKSCTWPRSTSTTPRTGRSRRCRDRAAFPRAATSSRRDTP